MAQARKLVSNFRVARWSMGFTRYTHSQVTTLRSTSTTTLSTYFLRTYAGGSLVVGTLGVALVAAMVVVVKSRFGAITEPPTAPAPVLV